MKYTLLATLLGIVYPIEADQKKETVAKIPNATAIVLAGFATVPVIEELAVIDVPLNELNQPLNKSEERNRQHLKTKSHFILKNLPPNYF